MSRMGDWNSGMTISWKMKLGLSVVFIDVLQVCHLGIIYEVEDNNNFFQARAPKLLTVPGGRQQVIGRMRKLVV